MSAYTLPAGNVQAAFSGGRTSAYLVKKLLDENGPLPDRVVVTFQNTGRERIETLDFVQECDERWKLGVVWLEYRPSPTQRNPFIENEFCEVYARIFGLDRLNYMRRWWQDNATPDKFAIVDHARASRSSEPFEALLLQRRFLANQQTRFCTAELKTRTAKRYLMSIGWTGWKTATGIRADEKHRLDKPTRERSTPWYPLAKAGIGRMDIAAFWKMQPFDLRLPNVKGNCWLGNCDGCFLKSEASIAAFTRDYPDDAYWWEGWEELGSWMTTSRGATWSKRYTRAEMRRWMEKQGDWALSTEGVLCAKDEGECTG